jgi:NADH-quinone oxidoreductase subunit J
MGANVFMFYLFSATILFFALFAVTSRRILRAAVFLLFALVGTSGFYFLLQYQFLAGVQLALYAGGIVVLIIFSILLTHHISHKFERPPLLKTLSGILAASAGAGITIFLILKFPFKQTSSEAIDVDMRVIGLQLMETGENGYALPFEVISILLLAAMIGAIVIAKKSKEQRAKNKDNRQHTTDNNDTRHPHHPLPDRKHACIFHWNIRISYASQPDHHADVDRVDTERGEY